MDTVGKIIVIFAVVFAPLAMSQEDYRSEAVTFDVPGANGIRLAGTLTLPSSEGAVPAAVLISGAGPQDRDGSFAAHKPFSAIAEYLSRRRIAVLRLDDRGVGGSTGDQARATWLDLAADAEAAEYAEIAEAIAPTALEEVSSWIAARFIAQ